ncbi:MAG: hypothetical protein N3H32_04270 [Nitrososphaeria archaeon]|nr:hypothetical protein [Nitrososphaeria archaeon]
MSAYPKYGLLFLAAGFGGTVFLLMLLEQYKHSRYQGKRAIALTRRLPGGTDDLVYIVYGMKRDLPREGGKYVYAVQDSVTKSWYELFFDHPIGELSDLEDTIPVGSFFVKMPVAYVEGVQLKSVKRPIFDLVQDKKLLSKILRKQPELEVEIPQIYVYGTNATAEKIFAGRPLDSPPSTPEELKRAYESFVEVDPDYAELQAKAASYDKELEKLRNVVDSFSDRIVEYGDIELQEGMPRLSRKWLLVLGAAAAALALALLLLRWLGWI